MGWLPQGVMSVNIDPDSSAYYVRAIYEKDETFEEEKTYLIDRLQQERREYFAYGSRGSEAEDYQNRYSGQMVWIDGNAGLFLELGRQEGRACLLLRYEPDGILTADGTVDEVADHCFRMSFDELTDPASSGWIFMDDENYLLYPDPFAGLQVGDRVRIWYEDGRFGTAYEDEVSIHIAAFEPLPQE